MPKKDNCKYCIFLVVMVGMMACFFLKGMDDRLDQIDRTRCTGASPIASK